MHTYFDIMADTAGFGGQTVHCPVNSYCTSPQGISTTLWKIPLYLKDKTWGGGVRLKGIQKVFFLKYFVCDAQVRKLYLHHNEWLTCFH